MNKLIIAYLCIMPLITHGRIMYDSVWDRLSSHPYSTDINNTQYERLFMQLFERVCHYPNSENLDVLKNDIINYLIILNTPTALRLLSDIGGKEFNPSHLIHFLTGAVFSRKDSTYNYINSFKSAAVNISNDELDEYITVLKQIGTIVLMCWSSGVFGAQVDNQIKMYLINQNTEISKKIYKKIGF